VDSFYNFYTTKNGNLSKNLFDLFWVGRFQEAVSLFTPVVNAFGTIESLGMTDALIYLHCLSMTNSLQEATFNFPEPPSKDEVLSLISYEISQESKTYQGRLSSEKLLSQPRRLNKSLFACQFGIEDNCKTAIETGTFLGSSSYIFSGVFENVHTIEADFMLHQTSTFWLNSLRDNIKTYHGNSGEILSTLLTSAKESCLIFLDAHWSTGITSKEYGICPLINELSSIFNSTYRHTIVIDDIRCMEMEGYPGFKEIFDTIPVGRSVQIEHDQMIIH